jgi:hypothetical protein
MFLPQQNQQQQLGKPLYGDDRFIRARKMLEDADGMEVKSHAQGLAKLLQAGLGSYNINKLVGEDKEQQGFANRTMADALKLGTGSKAGLDPTTGIKWEGDLAPDKQGMMAMLLQNERTAPIAQNFMMGDITSQRDLENDITRAKALLPFEIEKARAVAAAGGNGRPPAAVEVANEIQNAIKAGDFERANLLAHTAKMYDRGINPFAPPQTPADGKIPQYFSPQEIQGYGDAVGGIAGTKKGMETQAQKDVELVMEPQIAGAKVKAEYQADKQNQLPGVLSEAENSMKLIDEMVKSPGLDYAVGKSSVLPVLPGTEAADFVSRLDQVKGKQFLQAFQSLKGGGTITEVEGQKAEQAIARMQRSQTEKEFRQAAQDFKTIISAGVQRAKYQAGQGDPNKPPPLPINIDSGAPINGGGAPVNLKSKYGLE